MIDLHVDFRYRLMYKNKKKERKLYHFAVNQSEIEYHESLDSFIKNNAIITMQKLFLVLYVYSVS